MCGEPLGPPDYLAIAAAYRTIFLSGVPKLKASQRNETKRFILMVDSFYDARTRLVALAEAGVDEYFPQGPARFRKPAHHIPLEGNAIGVLVGQGHCGNLIIFILPPRGGGVIAPAMTGGQVDLPTRPLARAPSP